MSEVRKQLSAREAIERIAGVEPYDNAKSKIARAARKTGLKERTVKGAWHGEFPDDHAVVRLLDTLADNCELRQKIKNQIADNWELERETLHALAELRRRMDFLESIVAKTKPNMARANNPAVSALVRQAMLKAS